MAEVVLVLGILVFVLVLVILVLIRLYFGMLRRFREVLFSKKSLEVKYGKNFEQLVPFLEEFPGGRENFRFLGSPIDGVLFNPDEVVFIEIKTGGSKLSEGQRRVKELVERKRVRFREIRI